jgi:DNA-binding response OmpR family regulator
MRVRVAVEDAATRALAMETCERMAVSVVQEQADIAVVEATPRGSAGQALRSGVEGARGTVVLAGLRARKDLAAALQAGASAWMTVPVTPQQLTAGLVSVLRAKTTHGWEPDTCLPIADPASMDRPAVLFTPATGVDRFEVGWLLRRFARGYDAVEWLDGRIAVTPRVHPDQVAQVADRLRLLLEGRATAEVARVRDLPGRGRFEAAG